jgi:transglutaminase-like putative cysteine protease
VASRLILDITHRTRYRFDGPTTAVQYLRLSPGNRGGQRVHAWAVDAPGILFPWRDGHRNLVHSLYIHEPLSEIELVARGRVETVDQSGVMGDDGAGALPPDYWLREGPLTGLGTGILGQQLRAFIRDVTRHRPAQRLDFLHELLRVIVDKLPYKTGVTAVGTTAAEALALGAGVCQDHAHLFITVARANGIPARYVSGYLLSGSISGPQDVGHAWAEAYVPNLGWVGFDASNGICPTASYVRVALGIDYTDGCPVRGVRGGGGGETLAVNVSVSPLERRPYNPYTATQQ